MEDLLKELQTTLENIDYDLRQDWMTQQERMEAFVCQQNLMLAIANLKQCSKYDVFNNNCTLK